MTPAKAVPQPTPETLPYWEAARRGELCLPRCTACDAFFFYPRPFCPTCHGTDIEWRQVSGRGRLHTYLINHRPAPGFQQEAPYVIAIVELEEGPRMMSNLVGVEPTPEALPLDLPLTVEFAERGEWKVPVFRPVAP